jgi:hypothetical protein
MAKAHFSGGTFLVRLLLMEALVLGTYNPSGFSFFHWVITADGALTSAKVAMSLFLAGAYGLVVTVLIGSIGGLGFLVGAFCVLLLVYQALLIFPEARTWLVLQWAGLVSLAFVLTVGVVWSSLQYSLLGQKPARYVANKKKI